MLQADGGTRCAAITGGYVALRLALQKLLDAGAIETMPLTGSVAAVSVGMVDGRALCDLDYSEDSTAEVDANVVMTGDGGLVEVQATAERTPLSRASLDELLGLAEMGISRLRQVQEQVAGRARRDGRHRLIFATANKHKLREMRELLPGLELEPLPEGLELPPEEGESFAAIALDKARAAHAATGERRRSATTPGSRPLASAGGRGSTPPATAGWERPTRRTWRSCCARSGGRGRSPRRLPLRPGAGRSRRHPSASSRPAARGA